jgi:small subunit ribosomal protein S6
MSQELRDYELVFILSPDIPEEEMPAAIERVTQAVTSRGGEVKEIDRWGRKKLAYPIAGHIEGDYVLTQVRLDPARTAELEAGFHISEEVIRHLLVRVGE